MKVLDLFSGIGGFSLGLERAGMKTIAFCEINPFCQKVLKKHWPDVPVHKDITKLKGGTIAADLICGGYPCQPFSVSGERGGPEDDRHLWPEMLRIIKEVRPSWVVCENVYDHISLGLDKVLSDLEAEGYATKVFIVPALALNARHRRDRMWIVAHSACKRQSGQGLSAGPKYTAPHKNGKTGWLIDDGKRNQTIWDVEPTVGRVVDGVPGRMDRLTGLGNAVVPQIPEQIGRVIMELEEKMKTVRTRRRKK